MPNWRATNSAIVYVNDDANPNGSSKTLEMKTGTSIAGATVNTTYVLGLRVEGQKDPTGTVWFVPASPTARARRARRGEKLLRAADFG